MTVDTVNELVGQLQTALEAVLASLATELTAEVITLFLYDDATEEFYLPTSYGLYDPATFSHVRMRPRIDRVAGSIVRTREPIIAPDVHVHPTMHGPFARRERICSSGGFPIFLDATVVGVLFVSYRQIHIIDDADRQKIGSACQTAAAIIGSVNREAIMRHLRPRDLSKEQEALQALINLACNVLSLPIAIWWMEAESKHLRIVASTGLTDEYVHAAAAHVGDGSIISHIIETRAHQGVQDLHHDPRFSYSRFAERATWVAQFGYPIECWEQTRGVIELFSYEPYDFLQHKDTLQRLAQLARVTMEHAYHSLEMEQLARMTHELSNTADVGKAMQLIVKQAHELAGADSSTIFLLEKRTNTFIVGSRFPVRDGPTLRLPRSTGGLTRHIIETGVPVKIDDVTADQRVSDNVLQDGIRSLVGVRIQMEEERIGVLYVNGNHSAQFSDHQRYLLQMLADQASVALGWARVLLRPVHTIEQAMTNLLRLETELEALCQEIQTQLHLEFAAVQLIREGERVIETVYGSGILKDLAGRVKHYLDPNPHMRDIQADIALEGRIEIITGWDDRFDRWVFDEYKHDQLTRIFVPLMIVRDEQGNVVDDWTSTCQWHVEQRHSATGERTIMSMTLPNLTTEVFGTIEAGWNVQHGKLDVPHASALVNVVAKRAIAVYRVRLSYVLETIVDQAREIAHADSATLHFLYTPEQNRYTYAVRSGKIGHQFLKDYPPRPDGLGRQAIISGSPRLIPDPTHGQQAQSLAEFNPQVFATGIRTMVAFPLQVDRQEGVLYVHYHQEYHFTENDFGWINHFARRAVEAIRQVTLYTQMRDNARQLETLQSVAQSLVRVPEEMALLGQIAWNTLNVLAADVVTIYEYIQSDNTFCTPPEIAGRLQAQAEMTSEVNAQDAPFLLIAKGQNEYAWDSHHHPIMHNAQRQRAARNQEPFVDRESIRSSAGILLKVGMETVGVMFINYRRPHFFYKEEQRIIEILASSVAIAIKNQRSLALFREGERDIMTTLDLELLLTKITMRAAHITQSHLATLRRLDPMSDELMLQARYPETATVDFRWNRMPLDQGVSGWVARHGRPALIPDVNQDRRYVRYHEQTWSELCVPLLDSKERVIGTLNVESQLPGAFSNRDQQLLFDLARQAVIAIQNAEKQKHLRQVETVATVGDFATSVLHTLHNDIGALKVITENLQTASGDPAETEKIITAIQAKAEHVLARTQSLRLWVQTRPERFPLRPIILRALGRTQIPNDVVPRYRIPPELPDVEGGEQQLEEIFFNLFRNAITAMQGCEPKELSVGIEVRDREEHCWAIIHVHDTGVGIAREDLGKIFQRHFSTRSGGLGLGLWWTRVYIERLGGTLSVASQPGEGTLFTIVLPALKPTDAQEGHR